VYLLFLALLVMLVLREVWALGQDCLAHTHSFIDSIKNGKWVAQKLVLWRLWWGLVPFNGSKSREMG